jgi:hypothetical protein
MTMFQGMHYAYDLNPAQGSSVYVTYTAIMTGTPDGVSDYAFAPVSVRAGLYSGQASYASIVVPFTDASLEAFEARPNGVFILYQHPHFIDGSYSTREFCRFNFDDLAYSIGARSASITLNGSKQTTYGSPGTIALTGADIVGDTGIRLQGDGAYAIGLNPNRVWPNPNDTLTYAGDAYTVNRVDFNIYASRQQVTVTCSKV